VKLVLPSLVEGVDSRTWRSKQGSVQMLGAMAYCAPKQLGTALPSIVPKLSEILADPHPKVQSAARQALKEVSFQTSSLQLGMRRKFLPCLGLLVCTASRHDQLSCGKVCGKKDIRTSAYACLCPTASNCISRAVCVLQVGSVIRNAEVQELVPALLAAIADPNNKAKPALDTLLVTKFVNTVDAASLALIVPVVHRGLRDRSGDVKKKAARIVGNMCGLINEPKVSGPGSLSLSLCLSLSRARGHLSLLQPRCCRGQVASLFGVQDMAPYVPLLMPELQSALVDPLPEVRATAAKALGSLLKGMGEQHFQGLMPWLLATLKSEVRSLQLSCQFCRPVNLACFDRFRHINKRIWRTYWGTFCPDMCEGSRKQVVGV
jgi:hypothetical protein